MALLAVILPYKAQSAGLATDCSRHLLEPNNHLAPTSAISCIKGPGEVNTSLYIEINKVRIRVRKDSYTALIKYMNALSICASKRIQNRKQVPVWGLNEYIRGKTNRPFPNRRKDVQKRYYFKIPSSYVGLRGGASSPDDDDSGTHRVGGNDNVSDQSSDRDDSLYRVDIQGGLSDQPADASYENTNRNSADTDNLENHMAPNSAVVNGSDEPHYNGAPATQGHREDGTSDGEFNGDFIESGDVSGHVLRNGMSGHVSNEICYNGAPVLPGDYMDSDASNEYTNNTALVPTHRNHHVPQNTTITNGADDNFSSSRSARPSLGRMADDAPGSQLTSVSTLPPPSSRTSLSSHRSRIDSLRDAQQEEDDYVIDWWLCEPLGRTPSNATHTSSLASSRDREYLAHHPHHHEQQDPSSHAHYNPLAGYYDENDDRQDSSTNTPGLTLFPPPPNSLLSRIPYLDPGPTENIWPPNPGPPNLVSHSRRVSGITVGRLPPSPSPSPLQLSRPLPVITDTTTTAADSRTRSLANARHQRRRRRRNAIFTRLRATWRGVKPGVITVWTCDVFKRR
ncbi:hypothetical protein COCVIDRAFT_21165 [Bipolaris victoriae FI3]|uniref:Uncharacterized protein n=1 Tax=Bipolaris victoriae (strain FI3) TaxID=930091 RepID=W7E9M4_BIPV3|nr:hypothetical protein COCVIDRAFT_21165 [Bipolaris victoriae FI3]